MKPIHIWVILILIECGQNYHKRCVVKVPNNCSDTLSEDKQRRKSSNLQVPHSPSGGSNTSLASGNSTQTEDSGLVRFANFFTGVSLDWFYFVLVDSRQ